jgi:hypothetical protein
MWVNVKACCLHSVTMAWSYCLAVAGMAMQGIDILADALGDPNLRDQVSEPVPVV